jgi:hypothetical protein
MKKQNSKIIINEKQLLKLTIRSTFFLIIAFFILFFFEWSLKFTGAWLSGFDGIFYIKNFNIEANCTDWKQKHVLWIYLFPYLSIVFIYYVLFKKHRLTLKINRHLHLLFSWMSTLLLVYVFFKPFCDVLNRSGIFYAFSWMYINRIIQIAIGIILFILFLINGFKISSLFSSTLFVPNIVSDKILIIKQIIFLWFIPYFILLSFVKYFSADFSFCSNCLLSGLLITLIINSPLISSYKVIVK